jgi:hypothetical protein
MWLLDGMQENALNHLSSLPTTTEEWITALGWSTGRNVIEIRTKAIQELDREVRGVHMVELAIEYRIDNWLLRGYQELVERDEEISAEEETRLGRSTTSKIFRVRDRYLRHERGHSSWLTARDQTKAKKRLSRFSAPFNTLSNIRREFRVELEMADFVV